MADDLGQKGIWADLLRAASNIFRTPEDQEDPMKELRGMIEMGELGGAEMGGAVFPGAGFIGTIGRVGAGTKAPAARFLKRVLERSMKGFQGPAAAKPVVGEVVKKTAPVHKQLPMPSYQEVWRTEYIKALKGAKAGGGVLPNEATKIFDVKDSVAALGKYYNKKGSPDAAIRLMSPDEYISKVSKGMGYSKKFMTKQRPNLDYYRKEVMKGKKLDIPSIDYTAAGKLGDQDGMHRAMLAKELGIEKIPVFITQHKKITGR